MPPAVLIVDDRSENLQALEAVLAPLAATVFRAGSGPQALEAVLERPFAAILLDVEMPEMDGFATARRIREQAGSATTPIIFMTGRSSDFDTVARIYEAGAVDFVLKPFDPLVLRSKVKVFCDLAGQRTARERTDRLLRAAWESAPNGIALVDADGRLLEANPALQRLTGRDALALRGSLEELVLEADRPAVAGLRAQLGRGGARSAAVELRVSHPEHGDIPISVLASAVVEPGGRASTFLLQVTDLRERLRERDARATLLTEQVARAEAERLADRLAAVAAITEGLERHTTPELVKELCRRLVGVLRVDGVRIAVLDEHQHVVAHAACGAPTDEGLLDRALEAGATRVTAVSPSGTNLVPMLVDGRLIGAVAVVGLDPHDPVDVRASALLRSAVGRATLILERARLYERERTIAAVLQRDLLPDTLPVVPGVSLSAWFSAGGDGARVGGDWYDAIALPGGRLGVVVGDVAGHGVAAATRMGEMRAVARAYALEGHGPAELLRRLNAYQVNMTTDTMTTLVYAVVEPDRERVRFASAGHMPPLLIEGTPGGGVPRYLDAAGAPLGALEVPSFAECEVPLAPGAMLALYTDGLVERRREVLDAGLERLRAALDGEPPADAQAARARALGGCGAVADDDVTLVVIRAEEQLGSTADYTLTPDREALAALRRHLRRWLAESGAGPAEAADVVLAANEAMQDAIGRGDASGGAPIAVRLERVDDEVVVVVRDHGRHETGVPAPDRDRGLGLMAALVDDARVEVGGTAGGVVTLRRRLAVARDRACAAAPGAGA